MTWQPGNVGIEPVIKMLEHGDYRQAILVLELLLSDRPDDPVLLSTWAWPTATPAISTAE